MKKIIATVLAMVMALALCTVAFAADTYKLVSATDGQETPVTGSISTTAASTTTKDGVVSGTVAKYTINNTDYVEVAKDDATTILYKNKAVDKYLAAAADYNNGAYEFVGKEFTGWGTACGAMAKNDSDDVFYTANDGNDTTTYYVKSTATANTYKYLLVGTSIVKVAVAGEGTTAGTYKIVAHKLAKADGATITYDATSGKLATVTCKTCGVKFTYTDRYATAAGAAQIIEINANALYTGSPAGYLYTSTKAADNSNTTTSPKTFDAGIAMYVGMALTSVAGSAVVIGKKKEF